MVSECIATTWTNLSCRWTYFTTRVDKLCLRSSLMRPYDTFACTALQTPLVHSAPFCFSLGFPFQIHVSQSQKPGKWSRVAKIDLPSAPPKARSFHMRPTKDGPCWMTRQLEEDMQWTQGQNPSNGDGLFHPVLLSTCGWSIVGFTTWLSIQNLGTPVKTLLKYSAERGKRINFGPQPVLSFVNNPNCCLVGWFSISRTVRSVPMATFYVDGFPANR